MMDLSLLAPVRRDHPCGPNLEYDPDFVGLESMAEGRPEQQYGAAIIPAEEPDWRQVEKQAGQLLSRSKDLRVAHCYLRAATRTRGPAGLAAGLELFAALMETYWGELHPAMQADGEPDPLARYYAISALANPLGFLKDVRDCELLRHQNMTLTVRDLEQVAAGGRTAAGCTREQVARIAQRSVGLDSELAHGLQRCKRAFDRIEACAAAGFGAAEAPDLSALRHLLDAALQGLPAAQRANTEGEIAAPSTHAAPAAEMSSLAASGTLTSRREVEQALNLACQYFQQHEPASPVPLLLGRALRLMSMNFIEIVTDMAPDALHHIQTIAGAPAARNS